MRQAAAQPQVGAMRLRGLSWLGLSTVGTWLVYRGSWGVGKTFVAPGATLRAPLPQAATANSGSRVALRAQKDLSKMSPEDADKEYWDVAMQVNPSRSQEWSVFDGPIDQVVRKRIDGRHYIVNTETNMWHSCGETGEWDPDWDMPSDYVKKNWDALVRDFKMKRKKLKKKHNMGAKYPNGQKIYLVKMMDHPLVVKFHGPKYAGRAEWLMSPKEVEYKERRTRARELQRRLTLIAEQKRVKRLRELGVWLGEESWQDGKPWIPKVPFKADLDAERRERAEEKKSAAQGGNLN